MDPLSLTTGILAVISACATVASTFGKIKRLDEAPEVIQAMNNEISELQLLLADMKVHMERAQSRSSGIPKVDEAIFRLCESTLGRTKEKILEVDSFIQYRLLKADKEAAIRVHRVAFMRHRDKVISFQAELRECRYKVTDVARILEIHQTSRLELVLDDIRSQDLSVLVQGQARIERQLTRLVSRRMAVSNAPCAILQERSGTSANEYSSIRMSLSGLRPGCGHMRCTCFRQGNSRHTQNFLGTLFRGYGVAPKLFSKRQSCPHPHETEIRVAYYFPLWFLEFIFWLQVQFGMIGLSQSSLPTVQILPPEHIALDMIKFGEIGGIKQLLQSGQLSIRAQLPNGANLLHWSIWNANIVSTEFLVLNGADMFYESPIYLSAQMAAWDRVLMNDESPEYRDTLKAQFPKPDFEECYAFSPLHQSVLGLVNRSIETILNQDWKQINSTDSYGRTALLWAIWRGDYRTVEVLLSYKPDCNTVDKNGTTPLEYASQRSAQCLQLLLEQDTDIHIRHRRTKATPLHLAILNTRQNNDGMKRVEMLVEAGIDVNAQNIHGETALQLGAHPQGKFVKSARYLISHGANPEIYDKRGNNILSNAVKRNYHALIDLLLQERTDHTEHLDEEGTFVHLAAEIADTETLHLLARGYLKRRDINVKNKAGLTPIQLALQRGNINDNWQKAFWTFLRNIDEDIRIGLDIIAERSHEGYLEALESGESQSELSDVSEREDVDEELVETLE